MAKKKSSNLSRKKVQNWIKNGKGFKALCADQKCSANELEKLIEKIFHYDEMEEVLQDLRHNDEEPSKVLEEASLTKMPEPSVDELSELEKIEQEQLEKVSKLVENHKKLSAFYEIKRTQLDVVDKEIGELQKELRLKRSEFDDLRDDLDNIQTQIVKNDEKQNHEEEKLEKIRERIVSLSRILVEVTDSGEFTVIDGPDDLELSFEGWENRVYNLYTEEICEDLTIKEVKVLAKALSLAENNGRLNFVFGNENLNKAFVVLS